MKYSSSERPIAVTVDLQRGNQNARPYSATSSFPLQIYSYHSWQPAPFRLSPPVRNINFSFSLPVSGHLHPSSIPSYSSLILFSLSFVLSFSLSLSLFHSLPLSLSLFLPLSLSFSLSLSLAHPPTHPIRCPSPRVCTVHRRALNASRPVNEITIKLFFPRWPLYIVFPLNRSTWNLSGRLPWTAIVVSSSIIEQDQVLVFLMKTRPVISYIRKLTSRGLCR